MLAMGRIKVLFSGGGEAASASDKTRRRDLVPRPSEGAWEGMSSSRPRQLAGGGCCSALLGSAAPRGTCPVLIRPIMVEC